MKKHKRPDPLIEALKQQISYTITMADGGDLASMRKAVKHGETLTFSPVTDPAAIQVGDIVLVNWLGGTPIMHLVGAIRADQFLIINSLGKENGWVAGNAILGYVTHKIEPTACPTVPEMLDQLETAYNAVLARTHPSAEEATRLYSVAADLRWYAAVIEPTQWSQLPTLNLWSFEQHLWHLTKQAQHAAKDNTPDAVHTLLHHGKEHVGQVAMVATQLAAANQAVRLIEGKNQASITIRNVTVENDLVPLVNLRNLCAGAGAQPITVEQQREKLREPNQHPATDHWVAEQTGDSWTLLGQSFGYHTIPERYLAWLEVHPDCRRQGVGRELLKRVRERAKAVGADHILINVDEGEKQSAAHAFLQAQGFWAKSDVWFMRASADLTVATPQWPPGYSIRSFAEVQDFAILRQAYLQSYGNLWGHGANSTAVRDWPPEQMAEQWIRDWDPWGESIFMLFAPDESVIGLCRGVANITKGDPKPVGLVDAPGITTEYYDRGLQKPLTQAVMHWLRARGQGPLELSSFGDSAATIALYQELGFTLERHLIAYHLDITVCASR